MTDAKTEEKKFNEIYGTKNSEPKEIIEEINVGEIDAETKIDENMTEPQIEVTIELIAQLESASKRKLQKLLMADKKVKRKAGKSVLTAAKKALKIEKLKKQLEELQA